MIFRFILTLFATTMIFVSTASAQTAPQKPDYILKLEQSGAKVTYLGNDLGLNGWMTEKDGRRQYVYITPNQEANIVGVLLDRDGQLVTAEQIDRFVKANPAYLEDQIKKITQKNTAPTPPQTTEAGTNAITETTQKPTVRPLPTDPTSPAEKLYAQLEASHWVEIGQKTAPLVYAFIDPECPHCHKFIQDLRDGNAYDIGQIRTRLLPVGIMGEDSLYEAAKLIETPNPKKIFFDHLDGDEFALPVDKKMATEKVQKNMMIMQEWELDVTPFIIYRDKTGTVKIVRGGPKNLDSFLGDIN